MYLFSGVDIWSSKLKRLWPQPINPSARQLRKHCMCKPFPWFPICGISLMRFLKCPMNVFIFCNSFCQLFIGVWVCSFHLAAQYEPWMNFTWWAHGPCCASCCGESVFRDAMSRTLKNTLHQALGNIWKTW